MSLMAEDGTAGLTMARLARAMDIRPPSLYKYYPSLLAVYDALFRRGQLANLQALRDGMRDAEPTYPHGPLSGRTIALCVTGSIAAYKAVELARLLIKVGAKVLPVMSASAARFVGPVTLAGR